MIGTIKARCRFFVVLGCLLMGLYSCRQRQVVPLPEPITDTLPIVVPQSQFNVPISYTYAGLSTYLNGLIKGQFLETTFSPTGNVKDVIDLKMARVKPLSIAKSGNHLVIKLPLQLTATVIRSRLNFLTKNIAPLKTEVMLELHTPVSIDPNWNVVTRFSIRQLKWIKPPIIAIAGNDFDLTQRLDPLIQKKLPELTQLLNSQVKGKISLKPAIAKVWGDLQKPILISKKSPLPYLQIICQSIEGNLQLEQEQLTCFTQIKAKVGMTTEVAMAAKPKPLPPYKASIEKPIVSNVEVYAFVPFEWFNEAFQEKLKGKVLSKKKYQVTIDSIAVYPSKKGLAAVVKTSGDIEAQLSAFGQLVFDANQQTVRFDDFDFEFNTKSRVLNWGSSFLHDRLRDSIQKHLFVGLDTTLQRLPVLIANALEKGKTGKVIDLQLEEFTIKKCEIMQGAKRLHLLINTSFNAAIQLEQLNVKKKLIIKAKPKKRA